jgi:ASPIC and UnbV
LFPSPGIGPAEHAPAAHNSVRMFSEDALAGERDHSRLGTIGRRRCLLLWSVVKLRSQPRGQQNRMAREVRGNGSSIGNPDFFRLRHAFREVFGCLAVLGKFARRPVAGVSRGKSARKSQGVISVGLGVEPRKDGVTAAPWFELDCSGSDAGHKLCEGRAGKVIAWGAIGSKSSVLFDLDQDGDLDIVTNDFNSPAMVLISNLSERKPGVKYLTIRLTGTRSNRDGLGARVEVTAGGRRFTQMHDCQSGYLSQSALPLYFGLADAATIDTITVKWPSGARQVLEGPIATNRQLTIVETP